jgi:hypothetical protein
VVAAAAAAAVVGLGGRDLGSWRVMVKAVHSANRHFDDESLYREVKAFALDQILGTHLVPPCAGARLRLQRNQSSSSSSSSSSSRSHQREQGTEKPMSSASGLALAAEAALLHHPLQSRVSCLRPSFANDATTAADNKSENEVVTVDAALCLYIDNMDDVATDALSVASNAAAAAATAPRPQPSSSSSSSSSSFLSQPPKKKLTVPAAIEAAVDWGWQKLVSSSHFHGRKKSLAPSKMTKSTSSPTFFAGEQLGGGVGGVRGGGKKGARSSPLSFRPSHRNVAEYAVLSFLANCAKSSHNHFQLVEDLQQQGGKEGGGLPSLVMIDNDRCFTENQAIFEPKTTGAGSSSKGAPTPPVVDPALVPFLPPGLIPRNANKSSTSGEGAVPQEHLERFLHWRRLLWSSCEWIDGGLWVNDDDGYNGSNGHGGGGNRGGGGGAGDGSGDGSGDGKRYVGSSGVRDIVERLRWHFGTHGSHHNERPTLAGALKESLRGDALEAPLLSTDRKAFKEMDDRARELLARVDDCDAERDFRAFHGEGVGRGSVKVAGGARGAGRRGGGKGWRKLGVGSGGSASAAAANAAFSSPWAVDGPTASAWVRERCAPNEPGGPMHCRDKERILPF